MCNCLEKAEAKIIGKYKDAVLCEFDEIITTNKEGKEKTHGWGILFYNYKSLGIHAITFKYCPWCGKEI